jgi:hypothetical protein
MPYMTIILLLLLVPRRGFSRIGLWDGAFFATLALVLNIYCTALIGIALAAVIF